MKICISIDNLQDESFKRMVKALNSQLPGADIVVTDTKNYDLKDVDIFVGKKLNPEKLSEANKLKAIFAYKTGVDDFPLEKLRQMGIELYNSHANSEAVARYAFYLSTALLSKLTMSDREMRNGVLRDKSQIHCDITQMKVGLLGFGGIGQSINNLMTAFGVRTYTIKRDDDPEKYKNVNLVMSLEDLLKECDLIVMSLPKTAETNNIINARTIKTYLKNKYIVNVGRGNCIDEKALFEALKNDEIAGFASDTVNEKPVDGFLLSDHLGELGKKNVITTQHCAMQTALGHENYVLDVTKKVLNYVSHKGLAVDKVNYSKSY